MRPKAPENHPAPSLWVNTRNSIADRPACPLAPRRGSGRGQVPPDCIAAPTAFYDQLVAKRSSFRAS